MHYRVFVSYTHDSDSHRRQVLDLVQRLKPQDPGRPQSFQPLPRIGLRET